MPDTTPHDTTGKAALRAEDPARIDRIRPEFTEHASIESIDVQLRRARAQERRWHVRVEWLISLRQARVEQKGRGERPAVGEQPETQETDLIVAYRSPGTRTLYCLICARQEHGWKPLTTTEVQAGTACDFCGGSILKVAAQTLGSVIARYVFDETERLKRGRAQLLEAMSGVSEERTCAGWCGNWARTLHAEGGIWETLGRAVGWPTGDYGRWVWVSWDEAAALYAETGA